MYSSDFKAMTSKAIETFIQHLEKSNTWSLREIKCDELNYRNQTCPASLEMIRKSRERNEADIAYNNKKIVMMKAELQSRA
jgi:hypothetical protein